MPLPSKFGLDGSYTPSGAFEDVSEGEFGNIFEDAWDTTTGAIKDVANTVADVTTSIIDRIPGGLEVRQAVGDFAKTPAGSVFFRALATVTYQNLAWGALGPQLAAVAFAIPGLAAGDGFVESWVKEFNWRVSQTAGALPIPSLDSQVFGSQVNSILEKFKLKQLGNDLSREVVKRVTGFRDDAIDFALAAIKKIPLGTNFFDKYNRQTGEKLSGALGKFDPSHDWQKALDEKYGTAAIDDLKGQFERADKMARAAEASGNPAAKTLRAKANEAKAKWDEETRRFDEARAAAARADFDSQLETMPLEDLRKLFESYYKRADEWASKNANMSRTFRGKADKYKSVYDRRLNSYPPAPAYQYPTEEPVFTYAAPAVTQAPPPVAIPSTPMTGGDEPKKNLAVPAVATGIGLGGALLAGLSLPLAASVGLGAGIMGLLLGRKQS